MAKDWKLTAEQKAYLGRLSIWVDQSAAERTAELRRLSAAFGESIAASIAEIEEHSIPEILHALRKTYGAKPDPTRRLELLHDRNGQLPKDVSIQKAAEWCRVTKRRIQQLTEMKNPRLRYVGGKGHRRIRVADLIVYRPPEK